MNLDNVKRYTEDIITYENLLTPEECNAIIKVIELQLANGKFEWTPISFYESYSSNLPKDGDSELEECGLSPTFFSDLQKKIIDITAHVNDKKPEQMSKIGYHTQKWEPGAYAREHSDNTDIDGNPSPFERSRYAAFVYLNEDFDGGLLKFPKQDLTIKPKTGMAAAFAGGFKNTHEVTLIEKGIRYTLGSFWDDREEEDYPQELRDQWKEEMAKIREGQEIERKEWQDLLKEGYKIGLDGKQYKIEEME